MARQKLFVGIELDRRARDGCVAIAARLRACGLDARYDLPEKLHVTLAYLGWVEETQSAAVRDALLASARCCEPFALALDRVGAFPHERAPRVVYIGSRDAGPGFRRAAREVRDAFRALGFTFKEDAVAHVTIARAKGARAPLPMLDHIVPMRITVSELALFESLPAAGTTRYEVRSRALLARARS